MQRLVKAVSQQPLVQALPAQHGCVVPPQVWQVLLRQISDPEHGDGAAQQIWPGPPQGWQEAPAQVRPVSQGGLVVQQGWFA